MFDILTPVVLLLGGIYAVVKTGAVKPGEPTGQPEFPPESKALFLDTKTAADGSTFQAFKPDMATVLLRDLARYSIEAGTVADARPGRMLFRLIPSTGDCSAAQAALQAQANGYVVLGSLSLALQETTADQLLCFVEPSDRGLAAASFAVLLERLDASAAATAGAVASKSDSGAVAPAFDPAMPVEVLRELERELRSADTTPEVLRAMAEDLDGGSLPIGAKALRSRADALELQRKIASRRAPAPPAPPEAPTAPAVSPLIVEDAFNFEPRKVDLEEHQEPARGLTGVELVAGLTGELEQLEAVDEPRTELVDLEAGTNATLVAAEPSNVLRIPARPARPAAVG